jgi:acyl carrier protein
MTKSAIIALLEQEVNGGLHINEADRLDELGMDSLDYLSLIVKLEEKSGRDVPKDRLSKFENVGELVAFFSH